MTSRRLLAVWISVLAVGSFAAGCSGGDPSGDDASGHGSHGDAHESASAGLEPPDGADWNVADATFMTMMPVHHAQALEMADLAERHAQDRQVRALARSIDISQGLEIVVYASWLDERDLPTPEADATGMSGMDDMAGMDSMPGMLTDDELDELAAARGPAFDRLFLHSMIAHHRGALEMADDALAEGENVRVEELAADVVGGQSGEIRRMRDLLRG